MKSFKNFYIFFIAPLLLINTYIWSASVYDVKWNPVRDFLVSGGIGSSDVNFKNYAFTRATNSLTLTDSRIWRSNITTGQINAFSWSKSGNYLAVGGYAPLFPNTNELQVYRFYSNNRLSGGPAASIDWGTGTNFITSLDYSVTPTYYIAAVGYNPSDPAVNELKIYTFRNEKDLILTDSRNINTGAVNYPRIVKYDPTGKYLALGALNPVSTYELQVYELRLTPTISGNIKNGSPIARANWGADSSTYYVKGLAWSPNGKYLAACGNPEAAVAGANQLKIYRFDPTQSTIGNRLILVDSKALGAAGQKVDWSSVGNYITVGVESTTYELQVYLFNTSTETLTLVTQSSIASGDIDAVNWTADSRYFAYGDTAGDTVGTNIKTFVSYYGGTTGLGLIRYNGTSSPIYLPSNTTFLSGDYAIGSVTFAGGISVAAGNGAHLNIHTPVCQGLDLRSTGSLTLDHNLILDSNITLSNGGIIDAQGSSIILYGDLYITPNSLVKFVSNAVIDGQGNNVTLGKYSQFFLDGGVTVTFKNMVIKNEINTISCPVIRCSDWYSKACFDDVIFAFNDDFAFRNGQMFVHNDVDFTGTSKFSYRSVQPSYIAQHANLIFNPNTTLEFYPSTTNNTLINMTDKTSSIIFDDSTLLTTHTGIRLTKGSLYLDDKVTLSSSDNTAFAALMDLGIGSSTSFNGAFTVNWSPDGKYLAIGQTDGPSSKLYIYEWINEALVRRFSSTALTDIRCVRWSPDGKFLAVGCNVTSSFNLYIYGWDGSQLIEKSKIKPGTANYLLAISWSPDGKFLACGETASPAAATNVYIYSWNGSNLSLKNTSALGLGSIGTVTLAWSPSGRYLAAAIGESGVGYMRIYSWDGVSTLTTKYTSSNFNTDARSVSWSPDERFLALVLGWGLYIYSWNGSSANRLNFTYKAAANGVSWRPDGKFLAVTGGNSTNDTIIYEWDGTITTTKATKDFGTNGWRLTWRPDGKYLAVAGTNNFNDLIVYGFNTKYDTGIQGFRNGITFGNSNLGSTYDLDIHALAANRINLFGKLWHDSLNSWTFDSRDSYISLNRYDSKLKITTANSINNWKNTQIIKSSENNTLFLQNNQIWETSNSGFNLAPEETFEFMDDLVIPDNQLLRLSSNAIIDGQGHDLILGKRAQLIIDNRTTVTFKNITFRNTLNTTTVPPLLCQSFNSTVCFDNVTFGLNDDFTFTSGKIFFHNDVEFTGTSKFIYQSTLPSYITQHSNVIFTPNTTFEYYPGSANNNLIQMVDKTSAIIFDGSTLQTTHTGIRLTKGSLYFDNNVTLSSTLATQPPQAFTNSIIFGNSALGSTYDLNINLLAGARVNTFGTCFYDNVN